MTLKPRRRKPRPKVTFTTTLTWTTAEARRFARSYLLPMRKESNDLLPFTISAFLEEVESDLLFEEFLAENTDQYASPDLTDYFTFVAEGM